MNMADVIHCEVCGEILSRHGRTCKPKTVATKPSLTPVSVGSTDVMDALAERFERRASHIYRSKGYGTEEQRQMMTAIFDGIAEELRAERESASIGGDMPRIPAQQTRKEKP